MGVFLHSYSRSHRLQTLTLLTFLLFIASASSITPSHFLGGGARKGRSGSSSSLALERVLTQNRLSRPGSSPPTCRSKCGICSPCTPVHAAIHPGVSRPLEYYPEAWRCKCRSRLFMP